jgi:hypothetical protein
MGPRYASRPVTFTRLSRTRRSGAWWARLCAALALSAALVAGCGPRSSATQGPPGVIFQDDFSNTESGWDRHSGADATTDYDNGQYLVAVEDPQVDVWGRPGLDLTDVVVESDTQHAAGPFNNEFGLMCRYTRAGDGRNSFYFFFISSDGYYALGKVSKDARTVLNPADGSFQPADAIVQGEAAVNHLRASCQGTHFSLTVNGTLVGEFDDDEHPHGDIGVIAGTYDEGGVRLHFDNVVARQPE